MDSTWKAKEQGEEAAYAHAKEQEQLKALRDQSQSKSTTTNDSTEAARQDKPYEAGFGGQEDLEDRYATTSGEH
ncbi:hypothetical protein BDY19DRAFT_917694 [Irpex rosettiformis]|uniref:Uncharacterized protein n=1 Tax=Irpex rosettiformis TaxID=378272 RepID=A0ACB8UGT8_9APHY|nr:hypothetical protein BDY19DRAFT_917694 [Irpex rosettiformis]